MKKRIITFCAAAAAAVFMFVCLAYADFAANGEADPSAAGITSGWQTVDGKRYYYRSDGKMATRSTNINGVRYKFGADGVCLGRYTGWTKKDDSRYYYKNGIKQTDWCFVRKNWYEFDENGAYTGNSLGLPLSEKIVGSDFDFSTQSVTAADFGENVYAVADGEVVHAEYTGGYGMTIIIKHGGIYSLYSHCSTDSDGLLAGKGDEVKKGDVIAKVGISGVASYSCLGFEIIDGEKAEQIMSISEQG